ncbi:hypothetical protein [Actinoplanes sp. NPDC026623]|uniref:hypothetical protein n=1 Tax=Actinoplanes sp. NPDC026623 TaxID=3155610 RepID=UPI0033ECD666
MAEPGWPLIPREVLPAPVEPAPRRGRRRTITAVPAGRQLSIFGVEAADPSLFDLVGLLAGPGRLGRMGGTARVSVRVDAAWRVHVLVDELVSRGLVVNWAPVAGEERNEPVAELTVEPVEQTMAHTAEPPGQDPADEPAGKKESAEPDTVAFEVRTAFSSRLNPLARAWPPAADKLFLGGPRLRLWVAAAGAPRPQGYALGLDPDGFLDRATAAALTRAGLAGTIQAGPAYVIAGHRRLARLAELVGERPAAAPERLWPGGAGA